MKTMNVGGKGMPGPMSMRTSRRKERARAPCGPPSVIGSGIRVEVRRADGPARMEWHIHQPGYWRPPRQMDPWFEEQPKAYPEDALTLAPLHLGEWHPPLQAYGRCQHKDETTSRFRCLVIGNGGGRQHGRQGVARGFRTGKSCWWSPTCRVVGRAWESGGEELTTGPLSCGDNMWPRV